jgi:hypothetical protein
LHLGFFSEQIPGSLAHCHRFSIFKWIATLASDFLNQSSAGAQFFFDAETAGKHWFFVSTLAAIIFFIAFIQMMYYAGVMQWIIKAFAWFFFKLMNISGAEAVVASASPWVGQGESACLVKPYIDLMTPSEIHLTMTSGLYFVSTFYTIGLSFEPNRILDHLWLGVGCLYQLWRPSSKPGHFVRHEYSRFDSNQ